jgi:RHS repeat-associated protein
MRPCLDKSPFGRKLRRRSARRASGAACGESPSAQAQVESRRAHSRVKPERRALGAWGLLKYTYDLAGNLTQVRIDPASGPVKTLDYIIDASGRRVGKKLNGAFSKQYVWSNALRIEAELDGGGNIKSRFIYSRSPNSPELIVRKTTGQPDRVYRVISDQLGSPVFVVNIGQPTDVWLDATYDAWGNVRAFKLDGVDQGTDIANWPIPHGFAGGLLDVDTGLVRFGARDYDPVIGRWTARDPILFEGGQANLYVYVGNDPATYIDPSGLGSITNNSDRGVYIRDEDSGMKYLAPGEKYDAADGFYNDGSFNGDYFRKINTPTDITIYNSGERRFFSFDSGIDRLADDVDAFRRGDEGPGWKSFKWYNERFRHSEDKMCPR